MTKPRVKPRNVHAQIVDDAGKILRDQQRAKGTKMHPKQQSVKFAAVLLPFSWFTVKRRVKNKFYLLLTKTKFA